MLLDRTSSGDGVAIQAPAKVNLTLRVLGRRADGYHELESVVAALDWCDTLVLRPAPGLTLAVRGYAVPDGDENLVMRAARSLQGACGSRAGARIALWKRIPPGRGLGGGSADAAAALVGLNALWGAGLSTERLADLGAAIGSDVPFFFGPPLSVMRGRGERIEPIQARPPWWFVVAWSEGAKATAEVYAALDRLGGPALGGTPAAIAAGVVSSRRSRTHGCCAAVAPRPDATDILKILGGPPAAAAPYLVNDLEAAAANVRLKDISMRQVLERAGATAIGMTGSGPAYFALADTRKQARAWARAAKAQHVQTQVAQLTRGDRQQENTPCN
jgi:4-diphosphocytidyl-2-C-methyl-D-erythritol kinase